MARFLPLNVLSGLIDPRLPHTLTVGHCEVVSPRDARRVLQLDLVMRDLLHMHQVSRLMCG